MQPQQKNGGKLLEAIGQKNKTTMIRITYTISIAAAIVHFVLALGDTPNLRHFSKAAKTSIKLLSEPDSSSTSDTAQRKPSNLRMFPNAAKDVRDGATKRYIHDHEARACNFPEYVQADIVDVCTDTEYSSRSWVFNKTDLSYCNDGAYLQEMKHVVGSAQECAQTCVEDHDGYFDTGLRYGCDGKCACLVEGNEALDSAWDGKATSECYIFAFPLALAVTDPDGLDDDTWSC